MYSFLTKGWYYIKDGKKQEITLPAEIPAKTGEKLILYNESLGAESRGMTVVSTGAQYDLVIRLNGKILYEYKEAMFPKMCRCVPRCSASPLWVMTQREKS